MTERPRRGGPGAQRGQAAVELALALPLLFLMAMALLQVALVVRDQVLVVHVAREAAREAAVSDDPATVLSTARQASGLDPDRLRVRVVARGEPGSPVRVEVSYESPTDLPLIGPMVGEVGLSGAASMRVEQ